MREEDLPTDVSRRDALKKLGVAAGVAWSAPVVLSVYNAAGAATGSEPPSSTTSTFIPNPICEGATCGTFARTCSTNVTCICVSTAEGPGLCVPASTSCSDLDVCGPGNSCPPGSVCVVDSCCIEGAVCIPVALTASCPPIDGGRTSGPQTPVLAGPGTIGG